ncbi:glutamine amidotransferase-related protein, partial [Bacillus mycoides]|uniref:glutamine amidotransferase-related protein n=1 Tax=Bacillus mycoides TaxID=1405 RepID=UPI003CC7D2D9
MILIIHNYHSFTFNLLQFLPQLPQHLLLKPNDQLTISHIQQINPHFLMISPPPCTPNQAAISMAPIKYF